MDIWQWYAGSLLFDYGEKITCITWSRNLPLWSLINSWRDLFVSVPLKKIEIDLGLVHYPSKMYQIKAM